MIRPGATLGLLGGGQLGRMFTVAARTLGYRVTVLDPDPLSPAAEFATGHLNDLRARIYGERGGIEVAWEGDISRIRISEGPDLADGIWRELAAPPLPTTYERFIAAIRGEAPMDPDFHRGAALQAVLDRAEESDAHENYFDKSPLSCYTSPH